MELEGQGFEQVIGYLRRWMSRPQGLRVADVLDIVEEGHEAAPEMRSVSLAGDARQLVDVLEEALPSQVLTVMGPAEEPVATLPMITVATLAVRSGAPEALIRAFHLWAHRYDLHWCEPGSHYSYAKPCPKHEV